MVAEIPDPYPFIVFVAATICAAIAAVFLRELSDESHDKIDITPN